MLLVFVLCAAVVSPAAATPSTQTAEAPLGAWAEQPHEDTAAPVDLDAIYAAHPEGRSGSGALTVPVEVALCSCCGNVCLDVCVRDVDRACFGGRLQPAVDVMLLWTMFGAVVGIAAGVVLGLIPAIIFGVVSYQASVANGATADNAASAALASFALTDGLAACGGLTAGAAVGGLIGLFIGGDILAGPPEARAPQQRDRDRRGADRPAPHEDEVPPPEPPPAYDDDEPAPPGDAPPAPGLRF